jgi:hypothetical protein
MSATAYHICYAPAPRALRGSSSVSCCRGSCSIPSSSFSLWRPAFLLSTLKVVAGIDVCRTAPAYMWVPAALCVQLAVPHQEGAPV